MNSLGYRTKFYFSLKYLLLEFDGLTCCAVREEILLCQALEEEWLNFFIWEGVSEICTTKEAGDTLQARNCILLQALLKWWIRVRFCSCYLLSMQGGTASHLKQWVMRYGAEAYTSYNVVRSVF